MNFIDAAGLLAESAILLLRDTMALEAKNYVRNVVNAYDALAPDWANAPKYAEHYAIDADGTAAWYRTEPHIGNEPFWETSGDYKPAGGVMLPKHIDWWDCKWSREAAQ